jgi:AraC-like DNA-binding protein
MPRQELRVPARYYLRLSPLLAQQGMAMDELLAGLSLSLEALSAPDATLAFSEVDRLIDHVSERTGRSDLGFELGRHLSVSTHSIVGFGMLSSPSLGAALSFSARYFRLVMPSFRMRYTADPRHGELHFTPTVAMGRACLSFHLEAIGTAALRDVQDLCADRRPPCRMQLSIPLPPHAARYATLADVDVRFGAEATPGVRLRFEGDLGLRTLMMADPNALRMAEGRCNAEVRRYTASGQLREWVAMTLREVGEGLPSLTELAAMLNISTRTLNRHLEQEGTSYRRLAGEIQHDLARERLAVPQLSISEVAYSLGFSDPANFTRAFRDREGVSPRAYRLRQASHLSEK